MKDIRNTLDKINGNLPIIALTATATPKVQSDILKNLQIVDAAVFKSSFNRAKRKKRGILLHISQPYGYSVHCNTLRLFSNQKSEIPTLIRDPTAIRELRVCIFICTFWWKQFLAKL